MIQPLMAEVERLRQVMAEHREYLSKTESATRYAVIDPILRMLGWNVHDAASVKPEYRAGATTKTFVDYALLQNSEVVALIEAKSLDTKLLDKETEQLSNYCTNCQPKSVQWGILTNGDEWILIDAFRVQRPLAERVLQRFVVSHGVPLAALQELVSLFGLISGQAAEATVPAVTLAPPVTLRPPVRRMSAAGGQPLAALLDLARPGAKVSVVLSMADGQEVRAKNWAGLLAAVIEWLVGAGHLTAANCPVADAAGKQRGLVNTVPEHPDGRAFPKGPHTVGGLYYHTNYDALDCVKNAIHILETAGVDPAGVAWRPAS